MAVIRTKTQRAMEAIERIGVVRDYIESLPESATTGKSDIAKAVAPSTSVQTVTLTLTVAKPGRLTGVRTFYMSSFTGDGKVYTLKVIRRAGKRRMTCSCPDFYNRRQVVSRSCKHLTVLRSVIRLAHGVSNIAPGSTATVNLPTTLARVAGRKRS